MPNHASEISKSAVSAPVDLSPRYREILVAVICALMLTTDLSAQVGTREPHGTLHVCTACARKPNVSRVQRRGVAMLATPTSNNRGDAVQWPNGSTLRVKFLGGHPLWQQAIAHFANEWTQYANLHFQFLPQNSRQPADIRIGFGPGGAWSRLGTEARDVTDQSQPTMNFEWDPTTSEDQFRADTLHEFGHALGFLHEQQNPDAAIPWDRERVYAYYQSVGWDRNKVNQFVLSREAASTTKHTQYDPHSIMQYAVPNELTIGDFEIGWNTHLSELDKQFAAAMYPGANGGNGVGNVPPGNGQFGQSPGPFGPGLPVPPQFGQGPNGPDPFGPGSPVTPPFGPGPNGPDPYGQGQSGPGQFGQGQFGQGQFGQGQFGQGQFGPGPSGPPPEKVTQRVDNPELPSVNVEFTNTHSEDVLVQVVNKAKPKTRPVEFTIRPGESHSLDIERDAGGEIVQLLVDPLTGETINELSRKQQRPKSLYDVVVYEKRVTYRVIEKVIRGHKSGGETRSSLISIGVFQLPPGEKLDEGSQIDVYQDASRNNNPGAAGRFRQPAGSH